MRTDDIINYEMLDVVQFLGQVGGEPENKTSNSSAHSMISLPVRVLLLYVSYRTWLPENMFGT